MTTDEPLYAYVQRVWVARDYDERNDKQFVVQQIKALEGELDKLLTARNAWAHGEYGEYGSDSFQKRFERGEIW